MIRRGELMLPLMMLLLTGCASVHVVQDLNDQKLTSTGETPIAHLNGDNYGYYLFGLVPLIAGDPADTSRFALFRNTVTEQAVVAMVTKKSKELGATKTTDLVSRSDSTGLQTLFTVWYHSVQVSGNAVK